MKNFKRILSVFLSCTLLLGLLPAVSFAAYDDSSYADGTGTEDDPYLISDANQLAALANAVNGNGTEDSGTDYSGTYFQLTTDIDLSSVCGMDINGAEVPWTPIGKRTIVQSGFNYLEINNYFKGTFDGGGHTISKLYINAPDSKYQGLFGLLGSGGTVKNLGVNGTIVNAYQNAGSVCGWNEGGTISNCWSSCAITGRYGAGGVCGWNKKGTISNCYNTGDVFCSDSTAGGGVCETNYGGTITNCYNTGSVTGFVHENNGPKGICGDVMSDGTLANCYYNIEVNTSVPDTSAGVTGKTTAEFSQASTFTSWDFTDDTGVWKMDPILGRPVLREVPEPYFSGEGTADDPYLIPDLIKLEVLSRYVNSGNDCADKYFLLMADINMSSTYGENANKSWTPIGNNDSNQFKGTFDGGGHTISGLYINGGDYVGLFGSLDSGGTIKNLGVVDGSVNGGLVVGGVCGMNHGIITNCYNTGPVSGNNNYVGGICGYNNSWASITNCYNKGSVTSSLTSSSSVGGVCGINANAVENCYYLDTCGATGDGTSKTSEAFTSGEVAWLLQNAQDKDAAQIWGQSITGDSKDTLPVLTSDSTKAVYKVTFNSQGETTIDSQIVNRSNKAAKPNVDPTLTDHTFDGWYKEAACDNAWNFESDTVTGDTTLYAKWIKNSTEGDDSSGSSSSSSGNGSGGGSGGGSASGGTATTNPDKPASPNDEPTVETCPKNATCPIAKFADATPTAWYHDGIHYCVEKELMGGYGDGAFGPNNNLTRAELTQILYNKAERPTITTDSAFEDIQGDTWYVPAVTWASQQHLVYGYGDTGKFGPDDNITREQMVVILYRYANSLGLDTSARADLSAYSDADQLTYGQEAMQWAVAEGLIKGYSGTDQLGSVNGATRAEVSTVIYRLIKYIG